MKPKVAFFDFTSCEGCQLEVLNFGEELVELLAQIDIVNFREVRSRRADNYEIAFIDGAITTESDITRIKKIREQAKVLVAMGACACLGGVNCLKNFLPMEENLRIVYGDCARYYNTIPARPVSSVVPVDCYLPGCPMNRYEFLKLAKALLLGKKPELLNYPVCVECKLAGNICAFDKAETCLGPVTRAGCNAICVTSGRHCWGCRGLVDEPNINSEKEILQKHGLTIQDILEKYRHFNGYLIEAGGGPTQHHSLSGEGQLERRPSPPLPLSGEGREVSK
ncbi:MAG: NADH:ubiquinone oxidoreductase [Chloroflexi bacterium CG08_land_8_20_14_0_20_45_12]|nr:MAG: NADH:ubiquinone oxidoreductase [Chloroflexi bacterium CG08_land_8_20_14_0_20_45_12]